MLVIDTALRQRIIKRHEGGLIISENMNSLSGSKVGGGQRLRGGFTPCAVFSRLAARRGVFFLDSALPNEHFGRYSFLGCEPSLTLACNLDKITITQNGGSETLRGDPFDSLRAVIETCRGRQHPRDVGRDEEASDIPFTGGLVGYLGYDLRRFIERLPQNSKRDQNFPDMYFARYDSVLCHDALSGEWRLFGEGESAEMLRETAEQAAEALATGGHSAERHPVERRHPVEDGRMKSNFRKAEYLAAVERVIEYIAAGDIFQANLSQRFECEADAPAPLLYERLRTANPAPFAAYLDVGGGRRVMSSSPERFLRVEGRRVETRPIKGTRPRGDDPAGDAAMRRELLESEKDAAELAMIVDLERNDLGRVCEFGSVRVTEPRALETYATVHHLAATVVGEMREGCDIVDLLRAAFPGGSITGAPKIRAMEIIDEMEPTARGVYTGGIGYIGPGGRADINIAIRTLLLDGRRATFQVGGGIVADSEPEAEYRETLDKGRGIMRALKISA